MSAACIALADVLTIEATRGEHTIARDTRFGVR